MDSAERYPTVRWGDRRATFRPGPRAASDGPEWAAIVFAWGGDGWVLADIEGRGWTVPSGRIEPGETALHAAVRETWEEVGGRLLAPRRIGSFLLSSDSAGSYAAPAFVGTLADYGRLPAGTESRDVRCVAAADLPAAYYMWDALLERCFAYAAARLGVGR